MSRSVKSKTGEYSGAHVISLTRRDALPQKPTMRKGLPQINDVIIYNVRAPFGDRRTAIKNEQRGCMKVTGIYPSIVIGESYQVVAGKKEAITVGVSLQVNDFRMGNIVYVKVSEPVYNNLYKYDDWTLTENEDIQVMVECLHPDMREKVVNRSLMMYANKLEKSLKTVCK